MKLPAIIASDLHLTSSPQDEYRWGLFPWLIEQAKEERAKTLVFLGDITDRKDYHPAALTNRIVRVTEALRAVVPRIIFMRGNHDYLLDGHTYFKFLDAIPGVSFLTKPTEVDEGEVLAMFLPHTRNPAKDWAGFDLSHYNVVFMHQTIGGAVSSNGQTMRGDDLPMLAGHSRVYSGDIHVPQVLSGVEYVGSPYHVHFGDAFKPRCLALDRKMQAFDLHYETISRVTLRFTGTTDLRKERLRPGDQVKVVVTLTESERHGWQAMRKAVSDWVRAQGAELHDVKLVVERARTRFSGPEAPGIARTQKNAGEAVLRLVQTEELGGEVLDAGLECLE